MAKKVKNKKKKSKTKGPEPVTTAALLEERKKMLCPRLGDIYSRTANVELILEDVCESIIERAIMKDSRSINLTAMKLNKIPIQLTTHVSINNITHLNLSKNNLFNSESIFQSLFGLVSLKYLNLSCNFLNGLLSNNINRLISLEEIILDVNQLTGLATGIQNLINMKRFSICDNSIVSLPTDLSYWIKIESFNIKNNKVSELQGQIFENWDNIQRLNISYNLLRRLPEEIGNCDNLIEFDCTGNALESIPESLKNCTKIEKLYLGSNKIIEISSEILSNLINIKELQLYKNKITLIPPEIGQLQAIEKMSLASNNIKKVPEEIGECTNLKELYLSNNTKLSVIPSTAGHLRQLQELSLRKCPALKQLPDSVSQLSQLKELDLRVMKKKPACKLTSDIIKALKKNRCMIRGFLEKKSKAKKSKKT